MSFNDPKAALLIAECEELQSSTCRNMSAMHERLPDTSSGRHRQLHTCMHGMHLWMLSNPFQYLRQAAVAHAADATYVSQELGSRLTGLALWGHPPVSPLSKCSAVVTASDAVVTASDVDLPLQTLSGFEEELLAIAPADCEADAPH